MNSYKPYKKHIQVIQALVLFTWLCNLGLIFAFWWQNFDQNALFISFGRLAGLVAFYLILCQLLMICRIGFIERAFGHDRLSRWHHRNGIVAFSILAVHPVLIMLGYKQFIFSMLQNYQDILQALVGYLMFLIIIPISLTIVKKHLRYELWYGIHFLLYGAIILIFEHQLANGITMQGAFRMYWQVLFYGVFALVLWYRFITPTWRSWRSGFRVERIEQETHDVVSIYIKGNLHARAGQFVIVRFLARGFWYEAHPFTVSKIMEGHLRITPKAVGDFTSKLPNLPIGTPVLVEGPLGRFCPDRAGEKPVLLIAGGIGVTPLRTLFEEFPDAKFIYTARSDQDFALKNELDEIASRLPAGRQVDYTTERLTPEYITTVAPDVANRFVYLCGPPPMMAAVREMLKSLGVPKKNILYERFALG